MPSRAAMVDLLGGWPRRPGVSPAVAPVAVQREGSRSKAAATTATLPCVEIPFVDLRAQLRSIEPEVRAAIDAVLADTAFIGGRFVEAFEREFAAACGTRRVVGVSNGTDALILALRALGIGPGDEVITVPNTFIATTEAISAVGAGIRFADVDESSANLDPTAFATAIGARTKAVIPVHLYGRPAEMDAISEIARERGLAVIGDCAQAHGARFRDRPIASQFGSIAVQCCCRSRIILFRRS